MTQEKVRDVAVELKRFTAKDVAVRLGCHPTRVRPHIDALLMRGIVDWDGQETSGGRPANVFVYVDIQPQRVARRRQPPVELEVAPRIAKEPAEGVGVKRRRRLRNKDVRELAEDAKAAGVEVRVDKHVEFIVDGRIVTSTSKSPSDHRALKNARATLRAKGVAV